MVSYNSDTFQEIQQTWDATQDKPTVDALMAEKGVSHDEYMAAFKQMQEDVANNKATLDKDGKLEARGESVIRAGGRAVGDAVRGIVGVTDAVNEAAMGKEFADRTRSGAKRVASWLPEDVKNLYSEYLDPYHGSKSLDIADQIEEDTLGEDVLTWEGAEKGVGNLLSYFIPATGVFKVGGAAIKATPVLRKALISQGKKAGRARLIGQAVSFSAGEAINTDLTDKSIYEDSWIGDGIEKDQSNLGKYVDSFEGALKENLAFAAIGGVGKVGKDATAKYVKKSTLGKFMSEYFTANRGTHRSYVNSIIKRDENAKAASLEAEGLFRDLQRTLKGKSVDDLVLNKALHGDKKAMADLTNVSPESADILKQMRTNIDTLSDSLANKQVAGELSAILKQNEGIYVNTAYKAFDDPHFRKVLIEKVKNPAVRDDLTRKGIEWIQRNTVFKDSEAAQQKLLEMLKGVKDGDEAISMLKSMSPSLRGTSKIGQTKGKMPEELKELFGEIKDSHSNYARTVEKLSKAHAETTFMEEVKDDLLKRGVLVAPRIAGTGAGKKALTGELEGMTDAGKLAEERLMKIWGKGNDSAYPVRLSEIAKELEKKTLSPAKRQSLLNEQNRIKDVSSFKNPFEGLYMQPEYAKLMKQGLDVTLSDSLPARIMMKSKAYSQKSKTVYNPASHVVNAAGTAVMMIANGMLPVGGAGTKKAFNAIGRQITNRSNKDLGIYLADAQRYGVIDSGINVRSIRKITESASNNAEKWIDKVLDKSGSLSKVLDKTAGALDRKLTQVYQEEDNVFKLLHWEKTKKYLQKAHPEWDADKINKAAAERTQDLLPNYNLVPKAIQSLRVLPFGNFVSFSSEMLRNTKNLMKYTKEDMLSGNPELQRQAAKRLAGMTLVATTPAYVSDYSRIANGISKDQEDDLNIIDAPYNAFSPRIYTSGINRAENGSIGVDSYNIGKFDPFDYIKAGAKALHTAAFDDNPVAQGEAWAAFVQNQLAPFIAPSIVTQAVVDLSKGTDPFKGITAKEGQKLEAAAKIIDLVSDPFQPGFINYFKRNSEYNASPEHVRSKSGSLINEGEVDTGAFFGFSNHRLDLSSNFNYATKEHLSSMDKGEGYLNSLASEFNKGDNQNTKEDFMAAYTNGQKKKLASAQNLKVIMDSYRNLGFSDEDIQQAMLKRSGHGSVNNKEWLKLKNAEKNYFIPDRITGVQENQSVKTGARLPVEDLNNMINDLEGTKVLSDKELY